MFSSTINDFVNCSSCSHSFLYFFCLLFFYLCILLAKILKSSSEIHKVNFKTQTPTLQFSRKTNKTRTQPLDPRQKPLNRKQQRRETSDGGRDKQSWRQIKCFHVDRRNLWTERQRWRTDRKKKRQRIDFILLLRSHKVRFGIRRWKGNSGEADKDSHRVCSCVCLLFYLFILYLMPFVIVPAVSTILFSLFRWTRVKCPDQTEVLKQSSPSGQ